MDTIPPPSGTVTLMFTDLEGSTRLWARLGERFRQAMAAHDALIRDAIGRWQGYEVKTEGDCFMVAFARAINAVECAVEIVAGLERHGWPPEVGTLRVRIGLHTGEPFLGYDAAGRPDYLGLAASRAARICNAAHGGQILLSATTRDMLKDAPVQDLEVRDLGIYRLRGVEEPERLFQLESPLLPPGVGGSLRAPRATPHRLPAQFTSFIGRERELEELARLVRHPDVRLLTLTGPGGIGKTCVAYQIAANCAEEFPAGVWFADLSALSHAEQALEAVAGALGLTPEPEPDLLPQVVSHLAERCLLLILDGVEKVAGIADLVMTLLGQTRGVKLLVTSQAVLQVPGEQIYPLPPLELPPEEALPDRIADCESVRLFLERARLVNPSWTPGDAGAPTVAAICRRLEGIPLALELTAAHLGVMTAPQILRRLQDRFDWLAGRTAGLPARHQTLTAAIDWSYDLLTPEEKLIFARLSVLRGGFFLEAAEALLGSPALTWVPALCNRSLLHTREALGRMRYFMLEPIRAYAHACLEAVEPAAAAHADYFLALARQQSERLDGAQQEEALKLVAIEMDNLRAAWQWARDQGEDERAVRLALAMAEPLRRRGWWRERLLWLEEGMAAAGRAAGLQEEERIGIQYLLGFARLEHGDYDQARPLLEASLSAYRRLRHAVGVAECLNRLGHLEHWQGDFAAARQRYQEALTMCRSPRSPAPATEARLLNNLGVLAKDEGNLPEARARFEASLAIDRRLNNPTGIALELNNLGHIALDLGEWEQARTLLQESRALCERLSDRAGLAHALHNLGEVARRQGDLAGARGFHAQAVRLRRELDARLEIAESLIGIGMLLADEQRWEEAAAALAAAGRTLLETRSPGADAAQAALQQVEARLGPACAGQVRRRSQWTSLEETAAWAQALLERDPSE